MGTGFQTFEDLRAWQLAADLAERVYFATSGLPAEEKFGLVSQMRRAAVSIAANIAEGWGRGNGGDFGRFSLIARGSAAELRSHLLIARRVGLLKEPGELLEDTVALMKMLSGLSKVVREEAAVYVVEPD